MTGARDEYVLERDADEDRVSSEGGALQGQNGSGKRPPLLAKDAESRTSGTPGNPLADAIRREAAAWIGYVMAALEYHRTTAEMPECVLETLRPFRQRLDEAVETGQVLRELVRPQLATLAHELTSVDGDEIRRCAKELMLSQRVTTSQASMFIAALLRGRQDM